MYVSLALLADDATERLVQRLADEVYRQARSGRPPADAPATRLPAHVSLKQPFRCGRLVPVRRWFDGFAARTPPVAIELAGITYGEFGGNGIVGLEVVETPVLRALHNQINAELAGLVADPSAPFDGDAYRFHLTVALGPLSPDNPYRAYYEALPDRRLAHHLLAARLALGVCRASTPRPGTFRLERVAALAGEPDGGQ
jgi:2'-5' RNA ligase